jgi:K+-sensing histidine kinase KdpD
LSPSDKLTNTLVYPRTFPSEPFALTGMKAVLAAVAVVMAVGFVNWKLADWVGTDAALLVFILLIIVLPHAVSRGASILAACLSAVLWNYFFVAPQFAFHVERIQDGVIVVLFLLVAVFTAQVTSQLKLQMHESKMREWRLAFLYDGVSRLSPLLNIEEIVEAASVDLRRFFGAESVIWHQDTATIEPSLITEVRTSNFRLSLGVPGKYTAVEIRFPREGLDAERLVLLHAFVQQVAILLGRALPHR